jgi:hypothetical protein
MGSYWALKIDEFQLVSNKGELPDDILCLFQERDRRVRNSNHHGSEDRIQYEYVVSVGAMRERLDVLGFTAERSERDFQEGLDAEIERIEERDAEIERIGRYEFTFDDSLSVLRELTLEGWKDALATMARTGVNYWDDPEPWKNHPVIHRILDEDDYTLMHFGSDYRYFIRDALEALPDATEIILDLTDVTHAGYYDEDQPVAADAREAMLAAHPVIEPIVILTEGSSDTRIIKSSLDVMYPHLAELYTFLDFEEVRAEGGAEHLCKIVRAFAGARLRTRMVGLFDHDTAGHAALASLSNITLPSNIRLLTLPDAQVARDYPTVGPQGLQRMDVNEMAGGIELYLGPSALHDGSGEFRPVRWTGYNRKLNRYQGEVEGKREIVETYIEHLAACASPEEARARFPDMDRLLQKIFAVFTRD